MKSYVYLICDSAQDLFKIGVTKNLYSKRMKQLQTGNGTELHIVNYHETYYPYRIEQLLHNSNLPYYYQSEMYKPQKFQ